METMTSAQLAQLLYVAYYGRPADASGQQFWADQIDAVGVEGVAADFGASAEFEARFGEQTNEELVQNLYQQLFSRDGEQAGVDYWVSLLENGTTLADIALEIANGAQNDDVTAINNKVAVAQQFTDNVGDDYTGDDAANYARDLLLAVTAETDAETFDVEGAVNNIPSENLFTLAQALEAETLPEGYEINTVAAVDAGVVNVADATAAFTAVTTILEGAANAEQLAAANLFTWTVEDTLANLEAADAAVLEGAESYSLSETELATDVVTSDVAGLEAAVAEAGLTEAQQAIVDGAANAADVTVAVPYTLEDTLANLEAADATVLEGATSYSLTNEETDLGSLTEEQIALVEGADNAADFTFGVVGGTFSLTADNAGDIFVGTANNDTFNAEAGALEGTSIDGLAGNDTLNATYDSDDIVGAWTPTVRNVENINVAVDAFNGTAATFDATNVRGSTITLSSSKLGFNGTAGVAAAAANSVIAGENVTDLTVAGLTEGSVDAGSAETVTVDSATAGANTLNLTVNGDVAAEIGATNNFEAISLTATADAEVELNNGVNASAFAADTVFTVAGEGNVTLLSADLLSGEEIVNALESGELVADVDQPGADGSDWDVDSVNISAAINAFTAAEGAVVDLEATQTALTLTGQSATTGTVTVNTEVDQTSLTFATLSEATVNVNDEVTIGTLVTGGADTTVNVAADTTISTLTAAGDDVFVTGEGNVTIGGTAADADLVDASGLTGALNFTQSADANIDVVAGEGDDSITLAGTTAESNVVTGNGTNNVDATALTSGTLAVTGGAGSDTVELGTGLAAGATIALALGDGNDTLSLVDSTDASVASISVSGLETIDMNGSATVAAELVSGQSYSVLGGGSANGTLTVASTTDGESIDLSGLQLNNTIDNGVADVTITGGAGNETITGTTLVDSITGGAGDDTFVFASQSQSTAASTDVIADFGTGNDTIDLSAVLGGSGTAAAAITTAGAALNGTADEFGGNAIAVFDDGANTTVYVDVDGNGAFEAANDMQIELTGFGLGVAADDFLV